jgi:dUTP pyrophosphatase
MRISKPLKVFFELSDLAKTLEEELNIAWVLEQKTPFDNIIFLRNCSKNNIIIDNRPIVVRTGLYIQITDAQYEMRIDNYSNILRRKNIGILSGSFDFNYRNEIQLITYNYGDKENIIEPGEILAKLSFSYSSQIEIKKIYKISSITERFSGTKDHNWVQEDKKIKEKNNTITNIETTIHTENNIKSLIDKRLK